MSSPPDRRVIHLSTQEFTCRFETDTGFLRRINRGNTEIVRAIYAAVRDENWNTIQPQIEIRAIRAEPNAFRVDFEAHCEAPNIRFWWTGSIEGRGSCLSFSFHGEAKTSFRKNRIGLCILHPIRECAGIHCHIQQATGAWIKAEFPSSISPHQPFKDLRAMRWPASPKIDAELQFSGDIFETEDQRNWTDASFKTYCTPLAIPFPVLIEAGTKIDQEVILQIQPTSAIADVPNAPGEIRLDQIRAKLAMPAVGLGMASHGQPLSDLQLDRLRRLSLDHLRVDLPLAREDWLNRYEEAREAASALNAGLQTAIFLSDQAEAELIRFRQSVDLSSIRSCLIFHEKESATSPRWLELAERMLGDFPLVAGTNAYFTELNRQHPPERFAVTFSINPQVHAFDDLSLMENLEGQPAVVNSARQFCTGGVFVTPITLRPRFNPNATSGTVELPDHLPSSVDPRQRTLFGACWTAGSLAALLPCDGVASLTYFETTGWRGLMETSQGSPLQAKFGSAPDEVFPIYYLFEFLAGATTVLRLASPPSEGISALAVERADGSTRYIVANLESRDKRIVCHLPAESAAAVYLGLDQIDLLRRGLLPEAERRSFPDGILSLELPALSVALLQADPREPPKS